MCSNDFICFYDWAECRLIRRIDVNVKVGTDLHLLAGFLFLLYYGSDSFYDYLIISRTCIGLIVVIWWL